MNANTQQLGNVNGRNAVIASEANGAIVCWYFKTVKGPSSSYPTTAEAVEAVNEWLAGDSIGGRRPHA